MISSSSIAAASFSVIATITLLAGCSAPSGDQQACDMYAKAKQEMVESYNASAAVVNANTKMESHASHPGRPHDP